MMANSLRHSLATSSVHGFNSRGEKMFRLALRPASYTIGWRPTLPDTIMGILSAWACPFLRSQLKK